MMTYLTEAERATMWNMWSMTSSGMPMLNAYTCVNLPGRAACARA